jgi:hypothetical protein
MLQGLLLIAVAGVGFGCAGSRGRVVASNIRYPVSMTSSIYDANSNVYTPEQSELVRHFKHEWSYWSMLFTVVPLNHHERDISDLLSEEITSNSGDGIVNFSVMAKMGAWYLQAWLPVLPSAVDVTVEGDVFRLKGK